jgi:hypothetical protein
VSETASERRRLPPLRFAIPGLVGLWAIAFEIPRFVGLVESDPGLNDFRLFYLVAQAGLKWGWSNMYDPARLHELGLALGRPADAVINAAYAYEYSPLLAWLVAPLTVLPLPAAFYIWTAVNVGALVAAWWVASPGAGFARLAVLLVSLALWPTVFAFERGQPVFITFALAIGCWWMATSRRQVWAGVLLALAWAIKPQDVALLPAVLVLCGLWRAAAWWLLTTAALTALFALTLGPTGIGTFLAVLAWSASDPNYTSSTLITPFGSFATLLVAQAAFAAVALAGVWWHRRNLRLAFAIGIVGTLVSAIHLHEYDYVGLVVAAWLALGEPTSAVEIAWLAIGIVCAQLPSIGVRLPIVLWQPVWLVMLSLRGASVPFGHKWSRPSP